MDLKKIYKQAVSFIVALCILLTGCVSAFASGGPDTKQEVVYVNLDASGNVKEVYVVNIFHLNDEGKIVDYGDYTELRNMTGNEEIEFCDSKVSIYSEEKTLYYEGLYKGNVTPWDFSLKYYINGVEYAPEELAGKDGRLRIVLGVKKNEKQSLGFFENFALQMTLLLDTKYADNISAEGATIANVGGSRQLTYIVFPNTEKDFEITADIKNFRMPGFSINGVKMNIGIDRTLFENNTVLTSSLEELEEGVKLLDAGMGSLVSGSRELSNGMAEFVRGMKELYSGAEELEDGVKELDDGIGEFTKGTKELKDGTHELASGAAAAYDGGKKLLSGVSDMSSGSWQLVSGIRQLADSGKDLKSTAKMLYEASIIDDAYYLAVQGYSVDIDTSLETLQNYVTARQTQLTTGEAMGVNQKSAIMARIAELESILEGELTEEEREYYHDAWIYWEIALFGLEYAECPEDDLLAQLDIVAEFSDMLLEIGGINMVEDVYADLAVKRQTEGALTLEEREYEHIKNGITDLVLQDDIMQMLVMLSFCKGVMEYTDGVSQVKSGIYSLDSGIDSLYSGVKQLVDGSKSLSEGMDQIDDAVKELADGSQELKDGADELLKGVREFKDGIGEAKDGAIELQKGVAELYSGCIQLKDGTNELMVSVEDSCGLLIKEIMDSIEDMFGADFVPPSFTDSRNDDSVEFVQFVYQTEPISMPKVSVSDIFEEKLTFIQKLLKLFGVEV